MICSDFFFLYHPCKIAVKGGGGGDKSGKLVFCSFKEDGLKTPFDQVKRNKMCLLCLDTVLIFNEFNLKGHIKTTCELSSGKR